jgi:hypothetical protein
MAKRRKRQIYSAIGGRSLQEDFSPDYSYVIKDLRRIGTLAGTFLVILVVLSFFLR